MASEQKNLSTFEGSPIADAAEMKFGIVWAEWNHTITHALMQGATDTLLKHGAKSVSVYSNVVTVNGTEDFLSQNNAKMVSLMEKLYLYYGAGAGWAPEAQN